MIENLPTFEKKEDDYWRNSRSVSLGSLLQETPSGNYTQAYRVGDPTCIYQGQIMLEQLTVFCGKKVSLILAMFLSF